MNLKAFREGAAGLSSSEAYIKRVKLSDDPVFQRDPNNADVFTRCASSLRTCVRRFSEFADGIDKQRCPPVLEVRNALKRLEKEMEDNLPLLLGADRRTSITTYRHLTDILDRLRSIERILSVIAEGQDQEVA